MQRTAAVVARETDIAGGGGEEGISVIFLSHFQAYALPLKYQTQINGKCQEFEKCLFNNAACADEIVCGLRLY